MAKEVAGIVQYRLLSQKDDNPMMVRPWLIQVGLSPEDLDLFHLCTVYAGSADSL